MSETKHTPAPWKVGEDFFAHSPGSSSVVVSGPGFADICSMRREGSIEVMRANARLIAAAPDMLEALRGHLAVVDNAPDRECAAAALQLARAAIAKATGETR